VSNEVCNVYKWQYIATVPKRGDGRGAATDDRWAWSRGYWCGCDCGDGCGDSGWSGPEKNSTLRFTYVATGKTEDHEKSAGAIKVPNDNSAILVEFRFRDNFYPDNHPKLGDPPRIGIYGALVPLELK
jgi:hypothetical protein